LGSSPLNSSAVATFTISTLAVGSHSITATYSGDATFAGSTSNPLAQLVDVPADSLKLRALQIAVTKIEAQSSGSAVSSAIDAAIGDGFSGGGAPVIASDSGFHFNLMAEPEETRTVTQARVGDAFASLDHPDRNRISKAPALIEPPKQWLAWVDVRGTAWNTNVQTGDIRGGQVNALLGLTRKVTADLLVGVFGGYENFDYSSQLLDGRLKGDGWTLGGYLGWRFLPGLRFDAGAARAGVSYDGIAGSAAATFPGQRWIASAALVGLYKTAPGFEIEPSARVFAVWEHENAYTDSLGIGQTERRFSNGRASAGAKVAYPWVVSPSMTLTPYVGVYADYYFNSDDAAQPLAPVLLPTQFLQGWSSRLTGGVGLTTARGAKISIGGELGGIGSDQFTVWSARGRASVPF
jgi:outer membrane autotransporter protein